MSPKLDTELLARLDERTKHAVSALEAIAKAVEKIDNDVNGIGRRVSANEARVETHTWAIRALAGAGIVSAVAYLARALTS